MPGWKLQNRDEPIAKELSVALDCHPVVARLLVNRGIRSFEMAQRFFNASAADLTSPFALKDMDLAVRRIHNAMISGENIVIFGDYDADGVTSTAMLIEFFRLSGVKVQSYIPHRIREGYGLQPGHFIEGRIPKNTDLIITADCGIASHDAVASARQMGIDVIITDHHVPLPTLPRAVAVINPNRPDCRSGLGNLAGVGVAFYLVMALRKHLREKGFWSDRSEPNLKTFCDLVAIGTIADMVPLTGNNRILSKMGLSVIDAGRRPGIRALIRHSGIGGDPMDSDTVAYRLAPRLNAPGRVRHADTALSLLTSGTEKQANQLARVLDDINWERRKIEGEIMAAAENRVAENTAMRHCSSIVLWDEKWHQGVLGIVASRLVRKYQRPVILIAMGPDMGKGSCRSIPGIDILTVLHRCENELISFGGHAMAAGLSITPDRIESFVEAFDRATEESQASDESETAVQVDAALSFSEITEDLMNQIDRLRPFGNGNPAPCFMTRDVTVTDSRTVGKIHLRMRLTQLHGKRGKSFDAIWFNFGSEKPSPHRFDPLIYRPSWNRWNGRKKLQLIVEADALRSYFRDSEPHADSP